MDAYRSPFRDPDARLPVLVWPRELPIEGEPAAVVDDYGRWLPARYHGTEARRGG
jgi:haloalkane dehalogenase